MGFWSQVKSLFGGGQIDVRKRFELQREAVHGTMSKFYMARDREKGQIVGLKILDLKKYTEFEKRFRKIKKPFEGDIAMRFDHPLIVQTWEHGQSTKGETLLVMEYIEGQGLNTLISAKNPKLQGRRLTLLRQAAEALSVVHEAGFIHHDICPRNFVVSPECDAIKLIDFGLTVPDTAPFHQPGNRTGTPRYMAPEVVRRRKTDRRLDIFSFGVTAFELFAGEPPWPNVVTGQDAVIHDTQPAAELAKLCPELSAPLAEAIQACLAVKPADRPQSMGQFLERIESLETAGGP